MIQRDSTLSDFRILAWFLAFLFCSAIWGLLAGGIAFQYNIPFDFFQQYPGSLDVFHWFILGLSYGAAIALGLVLLEKMGAYNPVIAFVILMSGVILFTDMLFGRTSIVDSQYPVWLLLVPVVVIRDIITYFFLRDLYRNSDEIHEIDINCQTIEEPCFEDSPSTPADKEMLDEIDELACSISAEAAEYSKGRDQYLRA